jgi:hypothetical protein
MRPHNSLLSLRQLLKIPPNTNVVLLALTFIIAQSAIFCTRAQGVCIGVNFVFNAADWFPKMKTLHVCGQHLEMVPKLLRDRGFQPVNASVNIDGWGVMFGGHIHCGAYPMDEAMTSGLNAQMLKHANRLPQHSVYHSCLGCRESICSKRTLCVLAKWHGFEGVATPECYVLPTEHAAFASLEPASKWVLKADGKHRGEGVSYVNATSISQLPTLASFDMVQKLYFVPPNTLPIRVYVALTSSYPFRAHVYCHAHHLIQHSNDTTVFDVCHHARSKMALGDAIVVLNSHAYANVSSAILASVESIARASITSVSTHVFNRALQQRQSRCFTFWAVDLALTVDGRALAYEVNEFPYLDSSGAAQRFVVKQSHLELFDMLGLSGGEADGGLAHASAACLRSFCTLHCGSINNDATRMLVLFEHELATAKIWTLLVEEDPLLPEIPKGSLPWAQREYLAHRRSHCT